MLIIDCLAGMFAIDCVLCITASQLFACVLVPCVSNWCEETVTVICPEVTTCNGPVLIWWMQYMIYTESVGNHTLCYFRNDCRILKQKNPSEGSNVSSSKKQAQQIRQQPQC